MKFKSQKPCEGKIFLTFLLFALFSLHSFSQHKNLPLNREWALEHERIRTEIFRKKDSINFPTTFNELPSHDSSSCFRPLIIRVKEKTVHTKHSGFRRKLREESLVILKDSADKFLLTIDPLFNFEYGRDQADSSRSFYKNTRGILVNGNIGSQFSFESSFYENQATFVDYLKDFNDAYLVVPGQGRWKKFKDNGYDFAMASGNISYAPNKHFNFQIGHGKHFVGDGYRSLLLSDNTFNYPFARITSTFGKFQYTNLYASFMNLTSGGVTTPPGTERLFQKKAANFQLLSWTVHKRVQLGFFQGLIWQASDSLNRQCLKLPYASPVIYTAALTEGLRANNNVLLGATFKLKFTNSVSFYGQYMMDDWGGTFTHYRSGLQLGLRYFNVFGLKNLHLQAETNSVTAYSYASTLPAQSYTHYNQALAHPLGADFRETVAILNYRLGDFFTQVKFNYATAGVDHGGMNYGGNIFSSDTSGIPFDINWAHRELIIFDFHIGYLVNPSTNFNVFAGLSNRSNISPFENSQTNFVYFGIRTSLNNVYYDF